MVHFVYQNFTKINHVLIIGFPNLETSPVCVANKIFSKFYGLKQFKDLGTSSTPLNKTATD